MWEVTSLVQYSGSRPARRNFEFGRTCVVRPQGKHQATIVWLHGLGDNGSRYCSYSFPSIVVVLFCFVFFHCIGMVIHHSKPSFRFQNSPWEKKRLFSLDLQKIADNLFFVLKFIMERSVLRLKHQCVLAYHSLSSKLLITVFLWTSSDKQSNWASGNSMIYSLTSHQRFMHFYLFFLL
jgi:hypothetical protein